MTRFLPAFLLALTVTLVGASKAQAYVTYNRLGYISCAACHFVPTGGGLLSPYGRSVGSAMALLTRENGTDEKTYYQGVQARVIALDSSQAANPFLMQADYLGTAFINRTIHVDAVVGPNVRMGDSFVTIPGGWDGVVLRRALATWDLDDTSSVELGRDVPVAGLNIDDHTAFLRSRNRRAVFDYPTQLRYLYQAERFQLLPYLMMPSFEELTENREYGAGIRSEYLLNPENSVGLTALFGNSPSLSRATFGAYARLSHGHWNGLHAEVLYTRLGLHATGEGFNRTQGYLKPFIAIPEWIETSFVFEKLSVSDPFGESVFQYGPELNIRLHEYVSLIGDGRNEGNSANAAWSWYAQVFLHFQI